MKTRIVLIVDRSGSMYPLRDDATGGVNTFIEEQKALPDSNTELMLVEFDEQYNVVYDGSLAEAPTYKLVPRGSTALLDAIGKTLSSVKAKAKKKDKVLVNIITDGQENSSREWTKDKMRALMEDCRELGWEFLFLCADESQMSEAQMWGFSDSQTQTYSNTAGGTRVAYSTLSSTTTSSRTKES
jgi:uncharacterized protein YegL